MLQDNKSVAFPIVLYDGEREIDVGHINIQETLIFKQFQMMLKETIGISYNNLTTYFVEKDETKLPSERKKVLITGKVNFSSLIQEKNCYFLVVLKRSRRDRRRKVGNYSHDVSNHSVFGPLVGHEPMDWVMKNVGFGLNGYGCKFDEMRRNDNDYYYYYYLNSGLNVIYSNSGFVKGRELCKDCKKAEEEGTKAGFHFCVYDDVVENGFRSPVGPICRPK